MSYKLNKADPTRRKCLLARRANRTTIGGSQAGDVHVKHQRVSAPNIHARPPAYFPVGTPMKISRRNAMIRFVRAPFIAEFAALKEEIRKSAEKGDKAPAFPDHLKSIDTKCMTISMGYSSRQYGYGFHPTKGS